MSGKCNHRDQSHFVLLVGSIGSQRGDHYGDAAYDEEDEEFGGTTLQLWREVSQKG